MFSCDIVKYVVVIWDFEECSAFIHPSQIRLPKNKLFYFNQIHVEAIRGNIVSRAADNSQSRTEYLPWDRDYSSDDY